MDGIVRAHWSSSSVLLLIDSIAIAHCYIHIPDLRIAVSRDDAIRKIQLLEREVAVLREERERVPPKQ